MGMVKEFTTPQGVLIRIYDDAYASDTPEQQAAKRARIAQVVADINRTNQSIAHEEHLRSLDAQAN